MLIFCQLPGPEDEIGPKNGRKWNFSVCFGQKAVFYVMLNHPETFRQRMQSHATRVFVHINTPSDVWLDRSAACTALVEVWVTISSTAIGVCMYLGRDRTCCACALGVLVLCLILT